MTSIDTDAVPCSVLFVYELNLKRKSVLSVVPNKDSACMMSELRVGQRRTHIQHFCRAVKKTSFYALLYNINDTQYYQINAFLLSICL